MWSPRWIHDSSIDVKLPAIVTDRDFGTVGELRSESLFLVSHVHDKMAPVSAGLWRTLRAHQVYGANTDVGKTIVSTVLCNAIQRQKQKAAFLKPVSTGALDDADDR